MNTNERLSPWGKAMIALTVLWLFALAYAYALPISWM